MAPPTTQDCLVDIPAFLRRDRAASDDPAHTDERFLETRVVAPDEAELRALRRQVAARHRTDELSAWIRAINRRILVESLSARPSVATLQWLAACVSPAAVRRLEQDVRAGLDERAVVLAFIEVLGALAPDLDEGLSESTQRWLESQRRAEAAPNRDGPRAAAESVLDTILFGDAPRAGTSAAAVGAAA